MLRAATCRKPGWLTLGAICEKSSSMTPYEWICQLMSRDGSVQKHVFKWDLCFLVCTLDLNFFSTKWMPAAILHDRKSLSNAFLAISDQYTFFLPASILEVRFGPKTIGFFHYVLSMTMPNMKLIGECMTQLETPQAFWAFVYKMPTRGHFVFPIDAKNHRVLVIRDLNGYGEYEFDRCICDKVMACTSVGVRRRRRRRRRWRRNQKHNITYIFKFRGYN